MNNLQMKAVLAGLLFGVWPLFMNKSGLNAYVSSMAFAIIVSVVVTPFALSNSGDMSHVRWTMVVIAGLIAAGGVMFYNGALTEATKVNIGTLIAIQVVTQAIVPAMYDIVVNKGMSVTKLAGFACAAVAAFLLTKG